MRAASAVAGQRVAERAQFLSMMRFRDKIDAYYLAHGDHKTTLAPEPTHQSSMFPDCTRPQ